MSPGAKIFPQGAHRKLPLPARPAKSVILLTRL